MESERDGNQARRRHLVTFVVLPVLLLVGALAHVVAYFRMERSRRVFEFMDQVTVRHIPMIDAVHTHLWYPVGYAAVWFGLLFWLESRKARQWIVWLAFAVFAIPVLDYMWGCVALGTRFAVYNPP